MPRSRSSNPSQRTLQRRARAEGVARFAWNDERDTVLREGWLGWSWSQLALTIGCGKRCMRQRAADLGLPPRDPVQRAIEEGAAPAATHAISLPRLKCLEGLKGERLEGAGVGRGVSA